MLNLLVINPIYHLPHRITNNYSLIFTSKPKEIQNLFKDSQCLGRILFLSFKFRKLWLKFKILIDKRKNTCA